MIASTLELHVLSYAGNDVGGEQSVRLGHSPISVGRSPACHLSLDDAERLISRSHLSAWMDAQGTAWVRNASSATPVFVDGLELMPSAQARVQAGQTLVLGRYLLGVRNAAARAIADGHAVESHAVAGVGTMPLQGPSASTLPFAGIPEEFDVFAPPQAVSTASGGSATQCGLGEFSGEAAALSEVFDALPEFDARGPRQAPEVLDLVSRVDSSRSRAEPDPLSRLLGASSDLLDPAGGGQASSSIGSEHGDEIDALFRMPVSAPDNGSALQAGSPAVSSASAVPLQAPAACLDPMALDLGSADPAAKAASASLFDMIGDAADAPTLVERAANGLEAGVSPPPAPIPSGAASAMLAALPTTQTKPLASGLDFPSTHAHGTDSIEASSLPFVVSGPVAGSRSTVESGTVGTQPAARVQTSPVSAAEAGPSGVTTKPAADATDHAAALAAAFARGCGLQSAQLGALDATTMEVLGGLFQSLVAGTLQLVHARSSTKHELRAHMTIIATSGNNPLKFAPDAQAAMLQLVGRGLPGFMPPVEAVRDAFADLSAHQVGLLAASRSAMYAMAGRLAPEHIQQRTGGPRGFSGLLPSAHKAQLWDAYVAAHAQLLGEAREEFDAAFQGAFVDAYEGEVRRVQSGGLA